MSTTNYRLLNVGETIQDGDDVFTQGSWKAAVGDYGDTVTDGCAPYRRPSPVVMPEGVEGLIDTLIEAAKGFMAAAISMPEYVEHYRVRIDRARETLVAALRSLSSPALTEQNIRALVDAGSDEAPFGSTSTHASTSSPAPVENKIQEALPKVLHGIVDAFERELFSKTEAELEGYWLFKWRDSESPLWNLYEFWDMLNMYEGQCRSWEEHHHGSVCVVERVRSKYLYPKMREFLTHFAPPPVQGAGEPVAWMSEDGKGTIEAAYKQKCEELKDDDYLLKITTERYTIPLYTTPPVPNAVRDGISAGDLTDDHLRSLMVYAESAYQDAVDKGAHSWRNKAYRLWLVQFKVSVGGRTPMTVREAEEAEALQAHLASLSPNTKEPGQ